MTTILQGMPGTAHQLMRVLSDVLLKYEPRIKRVDVTMQEQTQPGKLHYVIDAELKDAGLVRYGTTFYAGGQGVVAPSETAALRSDVSRSRKGRTEINSDGYMSGVNVTLFWLMTTLAECFIILITRAYQQ